jgi:hypothetical protein
LHLQTPNIEKSVKEVMERYHYSTLDKEHHINIYSRRTHQPRTNNNFIRSPNKFNSQKEKEMFKIDCQQAQIVLEETVQKKSPWFHYNVRLIRLIRDVNECKIEYYDPSDMSLKGIIFLDAGCKPIVVDECRFDLITKSRTYVFKVSNYYKIS